MRTHLFAFSCVTFIAQYAWADNVSLEIQQLQAQITQLQTTVNSMVSNLPVATDTAAPLAELGTPNLPYSLLQAQNQYTAPLTFGGYLEADLQGWGGSNLTGVIHPGSYPNNGSALAATTANLYALASLNDWTQMFLTLEGGLNGYSTIISEALVNFGNLSKNPFYISAGKTELPFGTFPGNGLVTSTLESNAFESTQLAQIDLGFVKGNFNTVFALFNGQSNLNDFVYSLQYSATLNKLSLTGGAGYMSDLRYSGSDIAAAYGSTHGRNNIQTGILHGGRNGAVDLNADATYNFTSDQSFDAAAEWDTSTSSPTVRNVATGKMQAWSVTGSYTLPIFNKTTTFALDYSATINMHAVPLQLPGAIDQESASIIGIQNQWLTYFQSEILNNVYVGPEFAWLNLYNDEHTWATTLDVSVYF